MLKTTKTLTGAMALTFCFVLACTSFAFGQDTMDQGAGATVQAQTRTVATGEKAKLKGVIVDRDPDTFVIRDENNYETVVVLTDTTSVKSKGGFFRRGKNYGVTNLLRGLFVEVEGRGNAQGSLMAEKVRFDRDDLQVARSIDTRVDPVEGRLTEVEAQNRSLAGQVDELNEVSRVMKGDIERVDQGLATANERITTTNERISSIDDYDVLDMTTVYFRLNSSRLSPEGMQELDDLAQKLATVKGYMVEVAGFTDSTGSVEKNRVLSQRRADAVVRYMQENHDIPLRRMVTPFGYGETRAVADNDSREGREQNRRVEVKILVSRGLTEQAQSSL